MIDLEQEKIKKKRMIQSDTVQREEIMEKNTWMY